MAKFLREYSSGSLLSQFLQFRLFAEKHPPKPSSEARVCQLFRLPTTPARESRCSYRTEGREMGPEGSRFADRETAPRLSGREKERPRVGRRILSPCSQRSSACLCRVGCLGKSERCDTQGNCRGCVSTSVCGDLDFSGQQQDLFFSPCGPCAPAILSFHG